MKISTRTACAATGLLLAFTFMIRPSWASEAGLDFWKYAELESNLAVAKDYSITLDQKRNEVCTRVQLKLDAVDELLNGNLTFAEVVEEFLSLDEESPDRMSELRRTFPGANDRETIARCVYRFAMIQLEQERTSLPKKKLESVTNDLNEFLRHSPESTDIVVLKLS